MKAHIEVLFNEDVWDSSDEDNINYSRMNNINTWVERTYGMKAEVDWRDNRTLWIWIEVPDVIEGIKVKGMYGD